MIELKDSTGRVYECSVAADGCYGYLSCVVVRQSDRIRSETTVDRHTLDIDETRKLVSREWHHLIRVMETM